MKIIEETDTYKVFIEDGVKKILCKMCSYISDNKDCISSTYCGNCHEWHNYWKKNKK